MSAHHHLDDVLQDLAETTGWRLIVLDLRRRVIAYSIHETKQDRARLSRLLAHPDEWSPPAGDEPARVSFPNIGEATVLPLTDHRRRVGHLISFSMPETPSAPQLLALSHGAATLGMLLSLRLLYAERDHSRARQLLARAVGTDPIQRRAAAEALIDEGHVGAAGQYTAVAIGSDPRSDQASGRTALAVEMTLEFVTRSSTATVVGATLDDGTGILLFPRPVVSERLMRILGDSRLRGVRAGIGTVVPSPAHADQSFRAARQALRASWLAPKDLPTATTWDAAGLDGMIALLPLEEMSTADLPLSVRRLMSANLAPQILRTLETYLDCGCNAQRAADQLRIHRSTLYYRLSRVGAALDTDLQDGRLRTELHLGMRAARRLDGLSPE